MQTISKHQLERALSLRDLSNPAQGAHAMQRIASAITSTLADHWGCPVIEYRECPIVTIRDNYEVLGYPPDAPARESRYTRYVDQDRLLRTHASAMVPRAMAQLVTGAEVDVVVAPVGLVYRRDVVDRLHVGEPHQLDLWRVRRDGSRTGEELREMIAMIVEAVLPGARWRANQASHPYTEKGLEVEVSVDGRWVELLECGLAGSHVLRAGGLDERWSGLALGIGLDRALMLRKGITDIRLLRSNDHRVHVQMLDLEPYRPVSAMPATGRDLSIAVQGDLTPEELGDRVRAALTGEDLDSVEEMAVISETAADDLPAQAIERIGLQSGQKNVLVRLILRHPTRTMSAREGNRIRDAVYSAIHEGTAHQWAS
jgi:phenylalanyl-tRNA synthetase alpha chain